MIVNQQHVASVIEEETLKYLNELIYRETDTLLLELPNPKAWMEAKRKLRIFFKIFDGGSGNTRTALKYFDEMIEAAKISVRSKKGAGYSSLKQLINDTATSIKETTRLMKSALVEIGKKVVRVPASGTRSGNYAVGEISIIFDHTVTQLERLSSQIRQMADKYDDVARVFEKQYSRMRAPHVPGGSARPTRPIRPTRGELLRIERDGGDPYAAVAAWKRGVVEYDKAMLKWRAEIGTRRGGARAKAAGENIAANQRQSRLLNKQADELDELAMWLRDQSAIVERKHITKMEEKIADAAAEAKMYTPKQLEELETITRVAIDKELKAIITTVQKDGKIFNQKVVANGAGKRLKDVKPKTATAEPSGAGGGGAAPVSAGRIGWDSVMSTKHGLIAVGLAGAVWAFSKWWQSWNLEDPMNRVMEKGEIIADKVGKAVEEGAGGVKEAVKDVKEFVNDVTGASHSKTAGQGTTFRDFENQVREIQWQTRAGRGGIPNEGKKKILAFAKSHPAVWKVLYGHAPPKQLTEANYKPDENGQYSKGHYPPGKILWWYTAKELNKIGHTFEKIVEYGKKGKAPAEAVKYLKRKMSKFRDWSDENLGLRSRKLGRPWYNLNQHIKTSYKNVARGRYGPFFEIYGQMTLATFFGRLFPNASFAAAAKNIFKDFDPAKVIKSPPEARVGELQHYKYTRACNILSQLEADLKDGELPGGEWGKWGKYLKSYGIWTRAEYTEAVHAAKKVRSTLTDMYGPNGTAPGAGQWDGWNLWWWTKNSQQRKEINDVEWLEWRYKSFQALCAGKVDSINEEIKDYLADEVMKVYKEAATLLGKAKAAAKTGAGKAKNWRDQKASEYDLEGIFKMGDEDQNK